VSCGARDPNAPSFVAGLTFCRPQPAPHGCKLNHVSLRPPAQARRTAFGTFGGKLKGLTATELATHAAKAALADSKVRGVASGVS
jgi:hypothetical protein